MNSQRKLDLNITATIAYVGTRGVHQPVRSDDVNIVMPTATAAGYVGPTPVGSGIRINPNFGQIRSLQWEGSSIYHALELGGTQPMHRVLRSQGSFTWGKGFDT